MSKETNKEIFKQGEMINQINNHVDNADIEISKGVNEVKNAVEISEDNDSFTNKACIALHCITDNFIRIFH